MPKAIAGIVYFKIDGTLYNVRGNVKYATGDRERETITGLDGVHGYKEMPTAPFIECDISDNGSLDLKKLQDFTESTVTLELASGKQVILRDGWLVTRPEMDGSEGQATIRFEGMSAEEVTVNAGA